MSLSRAKRSSRQRPQGAMQMGLEVTATYLALGSSTQVSFERPGGQPSSIQVIDSVLPASV